MNEEVKRGDMELITPDEIVEEMEDVYKRQIVACARAAYRMKQEGMTGCKTILDLPPAYLSSKSGEELRKELL